MSTGDTNDRLLALGSGVTRRDFVGGTLLGAGAALLSLPCPAQAPQRQLGRSWTGYGGVGDYRFSNGNTAEVVEAAHRVRDGAHGAALRNVTETDEQYDLVIVGGGFAGMTALYEFKKQKPAGKCLLIENHPIFGGEAKQNEFDVDGVRLTGPQGSNEFEIPKPLAGPSHSASGRASHDYWRELELPTEFSFVQPQGCDPAIAFSQDNFAQMYTDMNGTVGYFFQNELTKGEGQWVKSIWSDDMKRAPLPEQLKRDLLAWRDYRGPYKEEQHGPWLDSMSYGEFVSKVMQLGDGDRMLSFVSPGIAAGVFGADARDLSAFALYSESSEPTRKWDWLSFPGGNATLLRHFVKAVFPDAIRGSKTFAAIANNGVNLAVLDRRDAQLRMRLGATAVRVTHEGQPVNSDGVEIVYEKGGQLYRVRAKAAILAIGSWIARHVATDVPDEYQQAMADILHGPILSVNVALHNWRFLDKLGISGARWFDGFGFFANVRQPMIVGDRVVPLHPDKPIVLTFYTPFLKPGLPLAAQGPAGRLDLYGTSYAEFERQIVSQMYRLFAGSGFNARRDIAGIVLNRWGHALHSPHPGFYFGRDGRPAPIAVLRKRFGRISFGHSELNGTTQAWETAAAEGARALSQALEVL
jgi:spermidine dehydrogenase